MCAVSDLAYWRESLARWAHGESFWLERGDAAQAAINREARMRALRNVRRSYAALRQQIQKM